ncbi:MAG: toll/interleukin-1 receptor domain-containing protein [Candidatus Thiosymbion ectosymbiont of Robbea hypermnestra]|nr:toll/interleukin-1 receptor domain-containing protein [Candidatus Thiosymbion ectosymbiont of Robbea hypermnestra]
MSNDKLVFISHSGEDTWVARQIAREVGERGARPFLDADNVDIGAEFEEEIRNSLNKADELVVLFTPWALDRPYIWMEIGGAWLIRKIPIIVVLHGITKQEFISHPATPVFLKNRNIIRLNDIDQYFEQLKMRVSEANRYD